MSCQTGIRADGSLLRFFNRCKEGGIRLAKIVVKDEQLTVNYEDVGSKDWRADWRRSLPMCVDSYEPCYIMFRLGEPHEWLLMTFADDIAPVREKMLLAGTRATLKSEFGQSFIQHEYHVTNKNDTSLENFERWLNARGEKGPLTEIERELDAASYERTGGGRHEVLASQAMRGISFPLDQDAEASLRDLAHGRLNYVQLSVDTLNEAIKLEEIGEHLAIDQIAARIPRDKPRYHFFRFKHSFNNRVFDSIVFVYSLPSSGCTIKERMLFSSCKGPFLDSVAHFIRPDKKIEMDSKDRLNEDVLIEHLHPVSEKIDTKFSKPVGPPGRGARRIIQ